MIIPQLLRQHKNNNFLSTHHTGRSPYVTFNNLAGDIEIPSFSPYNAVPITNAGIDFLVSVNDTGKIAPLGWHVPTISEFVELLDYLVANGFNWDGTTMGYKVAKSMASKTAWAYSNIQGTVGNDPSSNNSCGFSAVLGGGRYSGFWGLGIECAWWFKGGHHLHLHSGRDDVYPIFEIDKWDAQS